MSTTTPADVDLTADPREIARQLFDTHVLNVAAALLQHRPPEHIVEFYSATAAFAVAAVHALLGGDAATAMLARVVKVHQIALTIAPGDAFPPDRKHAH